MSKGFRICLAIVLGKMLSSGRDSIVFLKKNIVPLLERNASPGNILDRVVACLRKHDKKRFDDRKYTFINIEDLRNLGYHQSCEVLSSSNLEHFNGNHPLLLGVLTDKPKLPVSGVELSWNYLYLKDQSGALSLLVLDKYVSCIGNLVLILEWNYMPYYSATNIGFSYIEAISSFFDIFPYGECLPRKPSRRSIQRKPYSGTVIYISPNVNLNANEKFFMITLDTGNVVVLGHRLLHWREFLKPFDQVVFANAFRMLLEYSGFKAKLMALDEYSSFEVTKNNEVAAVNIENVASNGLVNYSGTVSSCSLAEDGVFELDRTKRLIVSHCGGASEFRGLREGALVDLYNVHLTNFEGVVHFYSCALSTIKVREYSFCSKRQLPFIAGSNIVTKECSNCCIKDYLLILKLVDSLCDGFSSMTKNDTRNFVHALLSDFLMASHLERNMVSEFIVQPHKCVISSEGKAPFPKIMLPGNVLDFLKRKKFMLPNDSWFSGDKYDRMFDADNSDNMWVYQTLSPGDLRDLVIVGEFKICIETGSMQLVGAQRQIDVLFAPEDGSLPRRQQILRWVCRTMASGERCILGLKKYSIVSEKFKAPCISVGVQKTYLLVDPFAEGNICFVCKREDSPIRKKAAKRKLTSTPIPDRSSKDIDLAESEHGPLVRPWLPLKDKCFPKLKEGSHVTNIKCQSAQSSKLPSANLSCQLVEKAREESSFCDSRFVVVFLTHVSMPYAAPESCGIYSSNIEGTVIGELLGSKEQANPSRQQTDAPMDDCSSSFGDAAGSSLNGSLVEKTSSVFVSLEDQKILITLKYSREMKKEFIQLEEGHLYVVEIENVNISNNIIQCDSQLGSTHKTTFHLAELKNRKLFAEDLSIVDLTSDTVEHIRGLFEKYCKTILQLTVRNTLDAARGMFTSSTASFRGIISSRDIKLNPTGKAHDKSWANEYFIKLYKGYSASLCLRIFDFRTVDEITVYVNLDAFDLPDGLLPGALVECKKLEFNKSRANSLYCAAVKSSCLRLVGLNEADGKWLQDRNTICYRDLPGTPTLKAKLSDIICSKRNQFSYVSWQLDLDFVAARWASFFWRCRTCRQKVAEGVCTPGCSLRWQFFCQISVIVGDGSGEVYLQIEQELLQNFLSVTPVIWADIKEICRVNEISYVKDQRNAARESKQRISNQTTTMTKRKAVEADLQKLFLGIHLLGPCVVECRLFHQDARPAYLGPRFRSVHLGGKECLMAAPREVNLQALRISRLDYGLKSQDLLRTIMSN